MSSINVSKKYALTMLSLYDKLPYYIRIMCKEYGQEEAGSIDEFTEILPEDYDTIKDFEEYKTFQIWIGENNGTN